MAKYKPVVLTILDGWGISEREQGNAILSANTTNMDRYLKHCPNTTLETSGEIVGLPAGQMGNSEVGHLNIGAGRIVYQDLTRISKAIKDGDFFENPALEKVYSNCIKGTGKSLHLMGLLSDGGVHSHIEHIFALIDMAKKRDIENLYIHCFLDGRDVLPKSAFEYVRRLEEKLEEASIGEIATISGRYYAMDRDNRWERVEVAYRAMVTGEGFKASSAREAIANSYEEDKHDEFVVPTVILKGAKPVATVKKGDSLVFFNFRADRAREITRAFVDKDFDSFKRPAGWLDLDYLCFTEYDATINAPVAFPPERFDNTLGQVLAKNNLRQLRISETEKYAHVTFFFNGGEEIANPGEERIVIPSSKVATYDLKPEMKAYEITGAVVEQIDKEKYDVIIINYANPDMIGHTGNFPAAIKAIEVVDECIGRLVDAVLEKKGVIIITSDHGNAEEMIEALGSPCTSHTTSAVPLIILGLNENRGLRAGGSLRDLAPTILELLEIKKPEEMTGESLLLKEVTNI